MDFLLYAAAALLLAVAFAHSYLGERFILIRLFKRDNLPKILGSQTFTKKTLRFAWHLTSVAWLGFAAILVALTSDAPLSYAIGLIITVTFAVHFLFALLGSKGRHLSWIVFLLVALLVYMST